jgi:tryptophan halogenase
MSSNTLEEPKVGRRRVVIVGGGTAGWMAAALISHVTRGRLVEITLVESEEIGAIGVGEATIPAIKRFNRLLELDEVEFIRATKATFKLGIEFVNWGAVGTRYFHPFGAIGAPIGRTDFGHFLTRRRLAGLRESFEDYSLNCIAARRHSFVKSPGQEGLNYAYHFDAGLYARYLRTYAEARGVRRVEGRIVEVSQNAETGFVEALRLVSGAEVQGDFFLDCSGLGGLLIEKTLKTGFDNWNEMLPCDRAVFAPSDIAEDITPFTRSSAHSAGWRWRIPLQHRIGNGNVYCSQFINDDAAVDLLMSHLDTPALAEPKFLRFQTGRRKLAWNANVVAIGLSSGFLEPLESTSVHLIHAGLVRLLDYWPADLADPLPREQYNRIMANQFEGIRDFLVLHYKATSRSDSEFWDYCRNMRIPDSLSYRLEHFRSSSRLVLSPMELFQPTSWLAVLLGQGILPTGFDPLADLIDLDEAEKRLSALRTRLERVVDAMPSHSAFLASLTAPRGFRQTAAP